MSHMPVTTEVINIMKLQREAGAVTDGIACYSNRGEENYLSTGRIKLSETEIMKSYSCYSLALLECIDIIICLYV